MPASRPKPTNGKRRNAGGASVPWYIEHAGRFAADPVFDEIVRLGRAYRQSQRPAPSKAKRARNR